MKIKSVLGNIVAVIAALACVFTVLFSLYVYDELNTAAEDAEAAAAAEEAAAEALAEEEAEGRDVPTSGISVLLNDYLDTIEGSAVDYLTTTAVASTVGSDEYINPDGNSTGKYIVCTADPYASVYSEPFDESEEVSADDSGDAQTSGAEEIARIYTYGLAALVSEEDGWCYVITGDIYGYVRSEDFAFGQDAAALDELTYITTVQISEGGSNLYELENTDSTVLCVLKEGLEFEILSEENGFVKIYVDGAGEGYVPSSDVVSVTGRRYAVEIEDALNQTTLIAEGLAEAAELEPSFIWPLPDGVGSYTSSFGYRWGRMHRGIDLACSSGTEIYAVMDGTVVENYYSSSSGYTIILEHEDGIYTLYYHMCQASELAEGTEVSQGDVIGYVGSTGRSTGSHLHFAVGIGGYENENLVDPAPYLGLE